MKLIATSSLKCRALFRLGQWVQLHPSIFRNAYLHPSILRKTPIVTIIFDNLWVQISFSSHICTHRLKILKRALRFTSLEYSKTPSNTAPSSTDLKVTLFQLDLKIFEQHWFFQSYTVFIFDRKPLESSFLMLESTLLKRKWGSKCYLVMVFIKWSSKMNRGVRNWKNADGSWKKSV